MDQARLQGSNLGCFEEGREILGVGTVPPLCAFSQRCVQAEYFLLTEGRYCTHIYVDHKVALISEESSMYMNFIDWIARTSRKKKKKNI